MPIVTTERIQHAPVAPPAFSPESNGLAEAFVKTLKRDYVSGAELTSAAVVLDQLPRSIADYNGVAPHSALGYLPPLASRARQAAEAAPAVQTLYVTRCLTNRGALQAPRADHGQRRDVSTHGEN